METHLEAFHIVGGQPLSGTIRVHSAKNSALYLILGAMLSAEPVILEDVPRLSDILAMCELLEHFGVKVAWDDHDLHIHAEKLVTTDAPYALVGQLRASFVAMGALLGRAGEAHISMPGGCAFGPRPVDRHIKAFRQLGVAFNEAKGDFHAQRNAPLAGRVVFDAPTVGGTQNIILASALGSDQVIIENAALEPEIPDLAQMLNAMGARISGAGTPTIVIDGVPSLKGIRYRALPDRIEAGTFMLAIAATRGHATLEGVRAEHLRAVTAKLQESGVTVLELAPDKIVVDASGTLKPVNVVALEYPGLPTDLQAPFGAYLATIPGTSVVTDRVYPDRFTHVGELTRTGAKLELRERTLVIQGGALHGAQMHAADIRAGGALIISALAAKGHSVITGVQYVRRGYERLAERLSGLGAQIRLGEAPVSLGQTGTFGD